MWDIMVQPSKWVRASQDTVDQAGTHRDLPVSLLRAGIKGVHSYCLAHTDLRTQSSCLSPGILGLCVYSHDHLDFGCYNALYYIMFRLLSYHSIGLGLCMRSEKAPGAFHRMCVLISFMFCLFWGVGGRDQVSL